MTNETNSATQLGLIYRAPKAGPTLDVLGVTHIYKAMANETGQQCSIWEAIVPPGAGAPPHTHAREDEAFYVLHGHVSFEAEGVSDPLHLGPGGFVFAPRNQRHAFRNLGTDAARLLVFAIPGGNLDRMFAAFDDASSGEHMPSFAAITEIAAQYGVVIHPPMG